MKSKLPIIPSCLVKTRSDFETRLEFCRRVSHSIQVDVADGRFVPSTTLPISEWPKVDLEYSEAHLMVNRPIEYLDKVKAAGFVRALVHVESFFDLEQLALKAKEIDLLLGFVVNRHRFGGGQALS